MSRHRLLALFLVALAAGCGRFHQEQKIFVPIQKTAQEQYQYAVDARQRNELTLRNKERMSRLLQARETVRQSYAKVVEYFPEDRTATPLAKLVLAEMLACLDSNVVKASKSETKRAIKEFEGLQARYAESEYLQAKSRFDMALCYKTLKEYEKAQQLFKEVEETYGEHKDREIRALAALSHDFYQQTYVKK